MARALALILGTSVISTAAAFSQSVVIEFAAAEYTVAENAAPGFAVFNVVRTGATNEAATVEYATIDGTATSGVDFQSTSGTLQFQAGQTNLTVSVIILDDPTPEGNERFQLSLRNPVIGVVLGVHSNVLVRIADNETPTVVDPAFDSGTGADNDIFTVALQPDRKILIGGQFTTFASVDRNRIARLERDGSLDRNFDPGDGPDGDVYAIALQSDGKILVGGAFFTYRGMAANYLVRLNGDGSLDATFTQAQGIGGELRAIAVQPDGKIVIGGRFTSARGQPRNRIARLNADGSLDTTFDPGEGANGNVRTLILQSDGRILIGGQFTSYNDMPRVRIARLLSDGALDTTFDPASGADDAVRTIAVQTDGSIYIGGDFRNYNNTARPGLARLSPNGALDAGFNPGSATMSVVRGVALDRGGRLWVGGLFTEIGGAERRNIARLLFNGNADPAFDTGDGANDEVFVVTEDADGLLLAAGQFDIMAGVVAPRIARLNTASVPPVVRFRLTDMASPEGTTVLLVVERSDFGGTTTVDYATSEDLASSGSDFTATSGTLSFAPGETAKTISVALLRDMVYEQTENLSVILSNAQRGSLSRALANINIVEASPSIEFVQYLNSVTEGDTRTGVPGTACLQLRRSGYTWGEQWSVDYEIIPGNAQPDEDFSGPLRGTVDFTIGNDFRCLPVPIINDGRIESSEQLTVRLVCAMGAVLTVNSNAILQIADDDGPIEMAVTTLSGSEGDGQALIHVLRGDNGPDTVSVNYSIQEETARFGEDYVAANGTITFQPGEKDKTIAVTLVDDCREELGETVLFTLSDPSPEYVLGIAISTRLTIRDNDHSGALDRSFLADAGHPPPMVLYPDGRILTADYGGKLYRLLAAGAIDSSFNATQALAQTASDATTTALALQPDGKIVLARWRHFIEGVGLNWILRLHGDGRLDTNFFVEPRHWSYDGIGAFALQPDGKIIASGARWFHGPLTNGLARLNPDGSVDPSFDTSDFLTWGSWISSVVLQTDGKVLISGAFDEIKGQVRSGIVRLLTDGALDTSFVPASLTNWTRVEAMAVQPDGRILLAGLLRWASGQVQSGLARLNADGSLDTQFQRTETQVNALHLLPDGKVLAGGTRYPDPWLVRLHPNGTLDRTFDMTGLSGIVHGLGIQPDSGVIAGGTFGLVKFRPDRIRIAGLRRSSDGSTRVFLLSRLDSTYVLEGSQNLVDWTALATNTAIDCMIELDDPQADLQRQRFYRVLERR